MLKIYIAGKITGDKNYREKFIEASHRLRDDYIVMSPHILPEGFTHEQYMTVCFAMLSVCDCVYMLKDWRDSPGAIMEHGKAIHLDKVIWYEDAKSRP